jgi:hypothetical protein
VISLLNVCPLLKIITWKILLVIILLQVGIRSVQSENFWNTLAQVSFSKSRDAQGYEIEKPVFSQYLKSFQGKKIRLKGYIIPMGEIEGKGKFMLSALPFNVCYFCGAAGPETVIEIDTKQKIKFTTRQIIMEGFLVLNDKDPDHHIYVLKTATLIQ